MNGGNFSLSKREFPGAGLDSARGDSAQMAYRAEFTRKSRLVSRPVNAGRMKPSSSVNLFFNHFAKVILHLDVYLI